MNFIKNYFVKKWSKEISREQADEEMRKAERVLKYKAEEHLAITLGRLLDLREFTWADYSMHQIHYETARSLAMALDILG